MKLDVLCSASDWAFIMAEADALQAEDPAGCMETARLRGKGRERRYRLVAAELGRRLALSRRSGFEPATDRGRWRRGDRRVHQKPGLP